MVLPTTISAYRTVFQTCSLELFLEGGPFRPPKPLAGTHAPRHHRNIIVGGTRSQSQEARVQILTLLLPTIQPLVVLLWESLWIAFVPCLTPMHSENNAHSQRVGETEQGEFWRHSVFSKCSINVSWIWVRTLALRSSKWVNTAPSLTGSRITGIIQGKDLPSLFANTDPYCCFKMPTCFAS